MKELIPALKPLLILLIFLIGSALLLISCNRIINKDSNVLTLNGKDITLRGKPVTKS